MAKAIDEVVFVLDEKNGNEVVCVWISYPDFEGIMSCYAHVGQHSSCTMEWVVECKEATEEQYKDLLAELKSFSHHYGYENLTVVEKPTLKQWLSKNKTQIKVVRSTLSERSAS